ALAAELRDQTVVAPSGTDSALRAKFVRHPLENRVSVIVEAAHEPGIDDVPNPDRIQVPTKPLEMLARRLIEILGENRGAGNDVLGVDVRSGVAEGFDVELMKLAKTSSLRLLVAKHRTRAPDALLLIVQEAVRDHRAHDAGSRLRTQRQRVATRILEREHLLLHDVRELADRAFEKRRVLDDG